MEISEVEYKELKTIEADNILAHTVLKWIEMILDGEEIDDFAMSFSIVRKVYELKKGMKKDENNKS